MTERGVAELTVEQSREQVKERIDSLFFDPHIEKLTQSFPELIDTWVDLVPKTIKEHPGLKGHKLLIIYSGSSVYGSGQNIQFLLKPPENFGNVGVPEIIIQTNDIEPITQLETSIYERPNCLITRVNKSEQEEIGRNAIICELLDLILSEQENLKAKD